MLIENAKKWPFCTLSCYIYVFKMFQCALCSHISEFTQQDGRKKRTAKHLCVTNMTGLLLACFVVIFYYYQCFLVLYKKICLKESEVCQKVVSKKIIVTLVTQGLLSSFLSRPVA